VFFQLLPGRKIDRGSHRQRMGDGSADEQA
jgi:hypothetical protein